MEAPGWRGRDTEGRRRRSPGRSYIGREPVSGEVAGALPGDPLGPGDVPVGDALGKGSIRFGFKRLACDLSRSPTRGRSTAGLVTGSGVAVAVAGVADAFGTGGVAVASGVVRGRREGDRVADTEGEGVTAVCGRGVLRIGVAAAVAVAVADGEGVFVNSAGLPARRGVGVLGALAVAVAAGATSVLVMVFAGASAGGVASAFIFALA